MQAQQFRELQVPPQIPSSDGGNDSESPARAPGTASGEDEEDQDQMPSEAVRSTRTWGTYIPDTRTSVVAWSMEDSTRQALCFLYKSGSVPMQCKPRANNTGVSVPARHRAEATGTGELAEGECIKCDIDASFLGRGSPGKDVALADIVPMGLTRVADALVKVPGGHERIKDSAVAMTTKIIRRDDEKPTLVLYEIKRATNTSRVVDWNNKGLGFDQYLTDLAAKHSVSPEAFRKNLRIVVILLFNGADLLGAPGCMEPELPPNPEDPASQASEATETGGAPKPNKKKKKRFSFWNRVDLFFAVWSNRYEITGWPDHLAFEQKKEQLRKQREQMEQEKEQLRKLEEKMEQEKEQLRKQMEQEKDEQLRELYKDLVDPQLRSKWRKRLGLTEADDSEQPPAKMVKTNN
eukprot:m51a1_g8096 hypothetical protein (407) ;mRNA; r:68307-70292